MLFQLALNPRGSSCTSLSSRFFVRGAALNGAAPLPGAPPPPGRGRGTALRPGPKFLEAHGPFQSSTATLKRCSTAFCMHIQMPSSAYSFMLHKGLLEVSISFTSPWTRLSQAHQGHEPRAQHRPSVNYLKLRAAAKHGPLHPHQP